MKKIIILFIALLPVLLYTQDDNYIDAKDHTVIISAEPDGNDGSITLRWTPNDKAEAYFIRRKEVFRASFPTTYIAQLDGNTFEYKDNQIKMGQVYEYEIRAACKGDVNSSDGVVEIDFIAFGYAAAGVEVEEPNDKGIVLLVVDETILEPLEYEINRLEQDLTLEGWSVNRIEAPRAETFDKEKVAIVKDAILNEYAEYGNDIKTVFLLGRVPVPYSGNLNPDAHTDHLGAWPADMFYGEMDDSYFRDIAINNSTAKREENKNIPNDGKFDISEIPGSEFIDLMVGRVDLYNMPLFEQGEIELLRSYLNQNHNYRTGNLEYEGRAIIEDDRFKAHNMVEGFASGAWRSFGTIVGGDNVIKGDFLSVLKDDNYMFAFGAGPGSYTSCGGIGTTQDYVDNPVYGLNQMLFGSYFGDWDSKNNILRAPLCNEYPALMNAWSGRPQWFMHHLSAGYSFGYSTRLTQNNIPGSGYLANVLYIGQWSESGVLYSVGYRQIHIALMGDPTLRMDMGNVAEPSNVIGTVIKNGAEISWEAPEIDSDYYFNIYRRTESEPVFKKINKTPLKGTEFTDNDGFEGKVEYMIKTAELHYTNTTSIFKESRGVIVDLLNTDVEFDNYDSSVIIAPNPAVDYTEITIRTMTDGNIKAAIYDAIGNKVFEFNSEFAISGQHKLIWNLTSNLGYIVNSGNYFLNVKTEDGVINQKISVVK